MHSEGGGGRVGPTGGHIKAPQVKSYNTTRHDLFLRLTDGREVSVSFPVDYISVREGNEVTLVSVFRTDTSTGYYARLFNNDTRLLYNVLTRKEWRILVSGNLVKQLDATGDLKPKLPGGLYQRALAACQQLKEDMVMG